MLEANRGFEALVPWVNSSVTVYPMRCEPQNPIIIWSKQAIQIALPIARRIIGKMPRNLRLDAVARRLGLDTTVFFKH